MAEPFVYVPDPDTSMPYSTPYHSPYYATPQAWPSPFLPPTPLLYPSSPYAVHSNGAGTPNAFNSHSVLWPDSPPQSPYTASWIPLPPQQHTNSSVPWRPTAAWGAHTGPYFNGGLQPGPVPLHIHPCLNGDAPPPAFHFDLAPTAFLPLRLIPTYPPSSAPLNDAELSEPAFYPPLFALRICIRASPSGPPILFADVLVALHRALHTRITHADWATLSAEDEARVTQAFVARCRAEAVRSGAGPAQLSDGEVAVRSQGVKRVDFLLGRTVFKGLVRVAGDPEGCVRMVTA
ncbi:hypothetical protein B0H13DRAFT_2062347 [Mycena leptocephala]|nr:hypothetical protein B0H13DRAFT_2062347 [Mycena leptocephala]